MYEIKKAIKSDLPLITHYKLDSILMYADNITEEEHKKIEEYVKKEVPRQQSDYKMIVIQNQVIGAFLIRDYEDGKLLDEIYIEARCRNHGIGTNIIKAIIEENAIVYLWVYKSNKKAIQLYKRLGFKLKEKTDTRYFMVHRQKKKLEN